MLQRATTVGSGDGYVIATWDRVLIEGFTGRVSHESLRDRQRAHALLYGQYPEQVLSLTIVRDGIVLPEASVREASAKLMNELAPKTAHLVVAIEGSGFWVSAVRGALTGIQMLAPRARRLEVVDSLDKAVSSLAAEAKRDDLWATHLRAAAQRVIG